MALCVPNGLEAKLTDWVREGGVLVLSGPFGLYDETGRKAGKLLTEVGGEGRLKTMGFEWDLELNKKPLRHDVASVAFGKGKVWFVPTRIGRRENEDMVPLPRILKDTFAQQPISCDSEKIELILRRDAKGSRYICAVNLDYGAPIETKVTVAGAFPTAIDLTIGDGLHVPTQITDTRTAIPLRLGPGRAAVLRLSK